MLSDRFPFPCINDLFLGFNSGNIIKRLHRAITHAHACKALLFLPEHDNWESFYPPPASRVIDFRNRAGGRHPRCSTVETRGLNSFNMSLEFGAGGEEEADPEASNWRLLSDMTYWTLAEWRATPPAKSNDKDGSARGPVIWFAEADMRAAGLPTDREPMHAWRKATEDLTTSCLRHYLGFCAPGFCDGAAGTGADAGMGATATMATTAMDQVTIAATTPAEAATGPSLVGSLRRGGRAMKAVLADQVTPSFRPRSPPPVAGPYLAVHIRQGDIYPPNFGRSPYKVNGQPPLAYYLSALSHQSWGRVDILAELDVPEGPVTAGLRLLRSFGALPGNLVAPRVDAHGLAGASPLIAEGRMQGLLAHERRPPSHGARLARAELVFPEERPFELAVADRDASTDSQIAAASAWSKKTTAESAAAWRADIQKMVCADAVVTARSSAAAIAGLGFAQAIYTTACEVPHAARGRMWMIEWDRTDGTVLSANGTHRSGTWRPQFQNVHDNSAAEWAGMLLTPAVAPVSCAA